MKPWILISALFVAASAQTGLETEIYARQCQQDPIPIWKNEILLPFNSRLASKVSEYSGGHFIISAHTVWLSLAGVAESAGYSFDENSSEWWNSLNFPIAKCIRDQIYKIALGLEAKRIDFIRTRALAIDHRLNINRDWTEFSKANGLLPYLAVDYNAEPFDRVQEYMNIKPKVPLSGHSVFLDRLDWGGLWTPLFADNTVTQGPFFNLLGDKIANVDYLIMKTKARVVKIPWNGYTIRVLQIPVGYDGKYSMILAYGAEPQALIETVFDTNRSNSDLTEADVHVAIPKLKMSYGTDLRQPLIELGLGDVFTDEGLTSYISEPPASPMGYLQSVNINITGSYGRESSFQGNLEEYLQLLSDPIADYIFKFDNDVEEDHYHFIANRPFLFSLFQNQIDVPVFTGMYSYPGQPKYETILY